MTTDHQAQVDAAREECKQKSEEYWRATIFRNEARTELNDAIDRLAALASAPPAPAASEPVETPKQRAFRENESLDAMIRRAGGRPFLERSAQGRKALAKMEAPDRACSIAASKPVAWMIEMVASPNPLWFDGKSMTGDPNAAIRFPSKESAEAMFSVLFEAKILRLGWDCYTITEHQWSALAPPAPAAISDE